MSEKQEVSVDFAGRALTIETGQLARQADAAVKVSYGDTVVLATAVCEDRPNPNVDFLPLRVDFEEKMYAVGRIPGGFFKREGRPSEEATVICRKIDRPIRPLVPKGLRNELQVICTALSAENQNAADLVAMIGAAAAMHLSRVPFEGPFATAEVGWLDGELILNPSFEEAEASRMELTVAAGPMGVLQVEMGGDQVPEEIVLKGIEMAAEACQPVAAAMEELRQKAGKPKEDFPLWEPAPEIADAVRARASEIEDAIQQPDKEARGAAIDPIVQELAERFQDGQPKPFEDIAAAIDEISRAKMRSILLEEQRRLDGRGLADIRPLQVEAGLLPRTHGSGLFTRGETQVLSTTTLGAVRDQKLVRSLEEEEYKRFMHHYNFPPFCTGEAKALRGASRREIGHGALVKRSLERMLPPEEEFPYTIRVVSEVLESNGSSSMASACASSLALMDAGVPMKAAVAGISVGLVYENEDNYLLLTDIQGLEDAAGDMDFKVTGTAEGVNGLHLDIKVKGVPSAVLATGLERAKEARLEILEAMNAVISTAREELSPYAPRMVALSVPLPKIGLVIGPGGKTIRKFEEEFGVKIDVEDDGRVCLFGEDGEGVEKARAAIYDLTRDVEVGEVFTGKVVTITDFGAFVEILPGRDGLVHISDLEHKRTERVEDVVSVGDEVQVKVTEVEPGGKMRLSRRALLAREGGEDRRSGEDRPRPRRSGGGPSERRPRSGGQRSRPASREPAERADEPGGGTYFRDKKDRR